MHVSVDHSQCAGTGQCVLIVPEVFRIRDEDGLSEVITPVPDAAHEDSVRSAENMCPLGAIRHTEGQ